MGNASSNDPGANATFRADAFAGVSLGSLIGVLLGFSVSSTVAGVVTGLVALLATGLGLAPGSRPPTARLTAFCLAMLVTTPLATMARTHDWLGASREANIPLTVAIKEWTDAGYPADEARQIVRALRFDVQPIDYTAATKKSGAEATRNDPRRGVLYAGTSDACSEVSWGRSEAVPTRLSHIESSGPPLDQLARLVRGLPETLRADTLGRLEAFLCGS